MPLKTKLFIEFLPVLIKKDCMIKTINFVWWNHRNRKVGGRNRFFKQQFITVAFVRSGSSLFSILFLSCAVNKNPAAGSQAEGILFPTLRQAGNRYKQPYDMSADIKLASGQTRQTKKIGKAVWLSLLQKQKRQPNPQADTLHHICFCTNAQKIRLGMLNYCLISKNIK